MNTFLKVMLLTMISALCGCKTVVTRVESDPSGAGVEINGDYAGTTPLNLTVPVWYTGRLCESVEIRILPNGIGQVPQYKRFHGSYGDEFAGDIAPKKVFFDLDGPTLADPEIRDADMAEFVTSVISEPTGAVIEIDNGYIGRTPCEITWNVWRETGRLTESHVVAALPIERGQYVQEKMFSGGSLYGDRPPKTIYFNMHICPVQNEFNVNIDAKDE